MYGSSIATASFVASRAADGLQAPEDQGSGNRLWSVFSGDGDRSGSWTARQSPASLSTSATWTFGRPSLGKTMRNFLDPVTA